MEIGGVVETEVVAVVGVAVSADDHAHVIGSRRHVGHGCGVAARAVCRRGEGIPVPVAAHLVVARGDDIVRGQVEADSHARRGRIRVVLDGHVADRDGITGVVERPVRRGVDQGPVGIIRLHAHILAVDDRGLAAVQLANGVGFGVMNAIPVLDDV